MSSEVDKRIVEMEFDNQEFERRIATTTNSLEKLQQSLLFKGATDGFQEIQNGINHINFDGLISGSTAAFAKIKLLSNAMNDLYAFGKRTFNSIVIDPPKAGWSKYEEITKSTQTIMAATAKDFEDEKEQMAVVNEQLEKLNWFTDETSYNLSDMTNNIGKFTSNGVKLDTAVTAMEGIGTWASISGASIGEAGRAMYNLSQALSTGSVKLIDWKSIENANMATYEFKENVIETAVAMGTLTKEGDNLYRTAQGHEVSATNFNEYLKDEWFSSEVLLKVLNKYGGFADKLNEYYNKFEGNMLTSQMLEALEAYKNGNTNVIKSMAEETGVAVEDLTEMVQELSKSEYDLGLKSFRAAQEAKTLTEAIEATQDAVSTAWMSLWKTIFGDYSEAKKVWTAVANELYDVFAQPIWDIQAEFESWATSENLESGLTGRMEFLTSIGNIWTGFTSILGAAKEALSDFFGNIPLADVLSDISHGLYNVSQRFALSEEQIKALTSALKGILKPFRILKDLTLAVFKGFKPLFSIFGQLADSIIPEIIEFGEILGGVFGGLAESDVFSKITSIVTKTVGTIASVLKGFIRAIGRILNAINRAVTVGLKIFNVKFQNTGDVVSSVLSRLQYGISSFVKSFWHLMSEVTGIKWFDKIGSESSKTWGVLIGTIDKSIKTVKQTFTSTLEETGSYSKAIAQSLKNVFRELAHGLDATVESIPFLGKFYKRTKTFVKTSFEENKQLQGIAKRTKDIFANAKKVYSEYKNFGNARRGAVVATNTVIRSIGNELSQITGSKVFSDIGNKLAGSINRAYSQLSRFGGTLNEIYKTNGGGKEGFLHALFYGTGTVSQNIFSSLANITGIKWFETIGDKINSYFEGLRAKIPGIMEKYAGVFDFVTNIFNVVRTAIEEAKTALVNAFHWLIGDDGESIDPLAPVADAAEASKERIDVAYKSVKEMVLEFIRGDWGNGEERDAAVLAAGYDNDKIQGVVNQVWSLYGDWKEGADEILAEYEDVDARLEKTDLSKKFKPLVDKSSAKQAKKNLKGVTQMTDNLSESMEQAGEKAPIRSLSDQLKDLRDKILEKLPGLFKSLGKTTTKISLGIQKGISKIVGFIEKHAVIDKIANGVTKVWGVISGAFNGVVNFFKKHSSEFGTFFLTIWNAIVSGWQKVWGVLSSAGGWIGDKFSAISPVLDDLVSAILTFDWESFKEICKTVFEFIGQEISEKAQEAINIGGEGVTRLIGFVTGIFSSIQSVFAGATGQSVEDAAAEVENTEGLENVFSAPQQLGTAITELVNEYSTTGEVSEDTVSKFTDSFGNVTEIFGTAAEAYKDLKTASLVGSLAGAAKNIKKASKELPDALGGLIGTLKNTLSEGTITDLIKLRNKKKFTESVLDVAESLFLIVAAIAILGKLPQNELDKGITAVESAAIAFAAFFAGIKLFEVLGNVATGNMEGVGASFIGIGKSILMISAALAIIFLAVAGFVLLYNENGDTVDTALWAVTFLMGEFAALLGGISFLNGKGGSVNVKGAAATILAIGIAILLLSVVVAIFVGLLELTDTGKFWQAIGAVASLIAALGGIITAITAVAKNGTAAISGAGVIIAIGVAILLITIAVAAFAAIINANAMTFWQAIGAAVLLIGALGGIVTAITAAGKGGMKVGGGIVALIAATVAIGALLWALQEWPIKITVFDALAVDIILAALAAIIYEVSKLSQFNTGGGFLSNLGNAGKQFAILAELAAFFAAIMATLHEFPVDLGVWDAVAIDIILGAFAAIIVLFGELAKTLGGKNMVIGAAAGGLGLDIIAGELVAGLGLIAGIDDYLSEHSNGKISLNNFVTKICDAIKNIGTALGTAVEAVALGLARGSKDLDPAKAESMAKFFGALAAMAVDMSSLEVFFAWLSSDVELSDGTKIKKSRYGLMAQGLEAIGSAIYAMYQQVIEVDGNKLNELIPILDQIGETFKTDQTYYFNDNIPELINNVTGMLTAVGQIDTSKIAELNAVFGNLSSMVIAASDPDSVVTMDDLFTDGIEDLVYYGITAMITELEDEGYTKEATEAWLTFGENMVIALKDGIESVDSQVTILTAIGSVGTYIHDDLIGTHPSAAVTRMKTSFSTLASNLLKEFRNWFNGEEANGYYTTATEYLKSNLIPRMFNAGRMISAGIAHGMSSNLHLVAAAAVEAANTVSNSFNVRAEIKSPSRMMWRSGMYIDAGLANGITDNLGVVNTATATMFSVLDQAMNSMSETASPVITPVVDMSNVDQSAARINGMFSGGTWIARDSLRSAQSAMIDTNPEFRQFNLESRPINYAETLNGITTKIEELSSAMSNMQVMLDGRKLVGSITPSVDRSLGQRAMHNARHN